MPGPALTREVSEVDNFDFDMNLPGNEGLGKSLEDENQDRI